MIFRSAHAPQQHPLHAPAAALLVVVLSALVTTVSSRAEAQAGWLGDRARTEGPGIRVGDFELHPGVGAEVGYDSNLYYTEDNSTRPRVETGVLRITPHIMLSTLGEERRSEGEHADDEDSAAPAITFRGGVSAAYYEFFADPNRRNLELDASLRLNILPERPFSFSIWDTFNRSIRPFTENSPGSTARISNDAGIDLLFQTTGGIFQVRLGYQFGLRYFEDSAFQYGNSMSHQFTLAETFRFLPSTGIIHETTVTYNDYFNYQPGAGLGVSPLNLSDSVRLRTRIGLNGALTESISLSATVGYAAGFFLDPAPTPGYAQDYDSVVANVEARWQISPDVRMSLGYDRDFFAAFLGNYYSRDRGYAAFQALIAGAFMVAIDGDVGYLDYGLIIDPSGMDAGSSPSREDIRVNASLFMEYRFTDWLGVNGTARYSGNFTDYQYSVLTTGAPLLDPAQYNRFEAYLGVRIFY